MKFDQNPKASYNKGGWKYLSVIALQEMFLPTE